MLYDENFVKPEIRDGWPVSEMIKKSWWIQLDLLQVFDRVCKKHNLRWYPIGGVQIGVIRHKGIIPWDDDIDVAMPREDYDKFMEICPKELDNPYFLQSPLTDKDCYQTWLSLRNSDTTGNRISCMSKRLNNGVAIDILPLEGCEDSLFRYKLRRFPMRIVSTICNTYVNEFNTSTTANILRKFLRMFRINYLAVYRWLERQNSRHTWDKYNKVTLTLLADPIAKDIRHVIWEKEDFMRTVDMPFENMITLPVPVGYDRILRTEYGDYMQFPPIEKRKGKHDIIFAPDAPYKEYCAANYGVKY